MGDELLESVLEERVLPEGDTQQWEASIFGCLARETAARIFLSTLVADMEELTEDAEGCLQELLADTDVAELVAGTLPDASGASEAAALKFTFGLLSCVPELILSGGGSGGPTPPDESLLWRYRTGGWVVNAPAVVDSVVYVGSDDNNLYALDASTGELLWSFETGDVIRSSPTVAGGGVYFGSNDNHVYALDADTGELMWKHDTEGWVQYSPTVKDGVAYLLARQRETSGYTLSTQYPGKCCGTPKAVFGHHIRVHPGGCGDRVYVPGEFGEFYALDAATGEMAWSFSAGNGVEGPPTVAGGVVYLTAVNTAHALDAATGALLWSYGTERFPAREFPAVVADGVYYLSPGTAISTPWIPQRESQSGPTRRTP